MHQKSVLCILQMHCMQLCAVYIRGWTSCVSGERITQNRSQYHHSYNLCTCTADLIATRLHVCVLHTGRCSDKKIAGYIWMKRIRSCGEYVLLMSHNGITIVTGSMYSPHQELPVFSVSEVDLRPSQRLHPYNVQCT